MSQTNATKKAISLLEEALKELENNHKVGSLSSGILKSIVIVDGTFGVLNI